MFKIILFWIKTYFTPQKDIGKLQLILGMVFGALVIIGSSFFLVNAYPEIISFFRNLIKNFIFCSKLQNVGLVETAYFFIVTSMLLWAFLLMCFNFLQLCKKLKEYAVLNRKYEWYSYFIKGIVGMEILSFVYNNEFRDAGFDFLCDMLFLLYVLISDFLLIPGHPRAELFTNFLYYFDWACDIAYIICLTWFIIPNKRLRKQVTDAFKE